MRINTLRNTLFLGFIHFQRQTTTSKLRAIFEITKTAYVSSITIYEIYKQTLAYEDKVVAKLRAAMIVREFNIIDVDPQIAEEGDIGHRSRIPMADSPIMAIATRYNLSCVSDDPHFSEVKRIWF